MLLKFPSDHNSVGRSDHVMIGGNDSLVKELTTEVEKKCRNDKAEFLHNTFGFTLIGSQKNVGVFLHIFLEAWNVQQQIFFLLHMFAIFHIQQV